MKIVIFNNIRKTSNEIKKITRWSFFLSHLLFDDDSIDLDLPQFAQRIDFIISSHKYLFFEFTYQ